MPQWNINPNLTFDELQAAASPPSGSVPEAVAWTWYDTHSFTTAVTTAATYFQSPSQDITLSNMQQGGSLASPNFHAIFFFSSAFLFPALTTNAANAGAITDLLEVLNNQRAVFTFKKSDKNYGPFPLLELHCDGAVMGYQNGAPAAPGTTQFGFNGPADGGYWEGGQIVLQPNQAFSAQVLLAAAPTLNTTPLNIRIGLKGTTYRGVF